MNTGHGHSSDIVYAPVIVRCFQLLGMSEHSYGWRHCKIRQRGHKVEIFGPYWKRVFTISKEGDVSLSDDKCNRSHCMHVNRWAAPPVENVRKLTDTESG